MIQETSRAVKIIYCLVLLSSVLPIGLVSSGWVGLAVGSGTLVPFVGPIVFLVIGLYRVYIVARVTTTLNAPTAVGFIAAMRRMGIFCLYIGAIHLLLGFVARPLVRALVGVRTENGAEYFVAGVYLSLLAGIGTLGLLLFEFSRLLAFERATEPKEEYRIFSTGKQNDSNTK